MIGFPAPHPHPEAWVPEETLDLYYHPGPLPEGLLGEEVTHISPSTRCWCKTSLQLTQLDNAGVL